jgi:hypothetical protein
MPKRTTATMIESDDGRVTVVTPDAGANGVSVEKTDDFTGSPLFDEAEAKQVDFIGVYRREPFDDEGYYGRIPGDSTEDDIFKRFGGGTFELQAYREGRVAKKKQVKVGGDPIFKSKAAAKRYAAAQAALDDGGDDIEIVAPPPAPVGPAPVQGLSLQDVMTLLSTQQNASRELMQIQMQNMAAEQVRRDEAAERERERDKTHMAAMMQILTTNTKGSGSEVSMLLKGLELAQTLGVGGGGGDDDDDVANDPVTVGIKSFFGSLAAGGGKTQPVAPSETVEPGAMKISGPIVEKLKRLRRGKTPRRFLGRQRIFSSVNLRSHRSQGPLPQRWPPHRPPPSGRPLPKRRRFVLQPRGDLRSTSS